MDKKENHFVLIHGDCHGAWCWYKVATILRSSFRKVTALDMAACGISPDRIEGIGSITDYLKPLMVFMEGLSEEERVILVGHSRGGIDISIAMEKFPGRIAAAVFVTAAMPGPDLDLPTLSKEFERRLGSPMDNKYTYGKDKDEPPTSYLLGPDFLASKLYQLSPPEDLTLAKFLIRPSPLYRDFHCQSDETVLTKENYGSVPRVYIVCDEDNLMKEDMQRWIIRHNQPHEVKVINGSDHMAMISKPHDLCSLLLEIADNYCR
ncbi:hypothetical protein ABFX02_11G106400 [Erythranthe guttata]